MASVYNRTGRSKWYAKIRDPKTGRWKDIVTPFRLTDISGKRKALVWAGEQDRVGETIKMGAAERWEWWVVDWINYRYGEQSNTLRLYLREWATVFEFLYGAGIESPHQVTRQHAQAYMVWRLTQGRKNDLTVDGQQRVQPVQASHDPSRGLRHCAVQPPVQDRGREEVAERETGDHGTRR